MQARRNQCHFGDDDDSDVVSRRSESNGKTIPPPSLPLCNSKDSTRQKRAGISNTAAKGVA